MAKVAETRRDRDHVTEKGHAGWVELAPPVKVIGSPKPALGEAKLESAVRLAFSGLRERRK